MCEKLLKVEDVADLLGVTTQTVYMYIHQNTIPYLRVSEKTIRFRKEDIEKWLEEKLKIPMKNNGNGNGNGDNHNKQGKSNSCLAGYKN